MRCFYICQPAVSIVSTLKMEAEYSVETLISYQASVQRHILEHDGRDIHRRVNLRSHKRVRSPFPPFHCILCLPLSLLIIILS
jgi:hypothetical protein